MRVHHFNCSANARGELANHCLLVESPAGLVLVDSGFGMRDVMDPASRLGRICLNVMRPRLRSDVTAVRQVRKLGFDARDVRHVVLTHLDCDRAGGLDDFPLATIHVRAAEVGAAVAQATHIDRARYRPQQWASRDRWRTYGVGGDTLWGFDGVRRLGGLPPEILLVPLPGHTVPTAAGCSTLAMRTSSAARWTCRTRAARRRSGSTAG